MAGELTGGKVQVEPWVVLYAVRYGLGRKTYAHEDACRLVRDHWPDLRRWADSIVRDLHEQLDQQGLAGDQRRAVADTLEFIARYEEVRQHTKGRTLRAYDEEAEE